jgi:hypothetical protein
MDRRARKMPSAPQTVEDFCRYSATFAYLIHNDYLKTIEPCDACKP